MVPGECKRRPERQPCELVRSRLGLMLTSGQFNDLLLYVAAIWIFIISATFLCIFVGWIGSKWHRHHGRKCPECDYMGDPVDVLTHHTLEHWDAHS